MELPSHQVRDIAVQHKLRKCLNQQRPEPDELGVKVPVVAELRDGNSVRYGRLGSQFCGRDAGEALDAFRNQAFKARCSNGLVLS